MKITYIGPMPEVFVPAHDPYLDIARGDTVDMEESVALSLIANGEWVKATPKPRK